MANKKLIDQVISFIVSRPLEELKELTITDITRSFGVSKMHLITQFKSRTGITPGKFILREKMHRVVPMMENNPSLTVKEIARLAGFSTSDYFIRVFKSYFGIPPNQYRNARLGNDRRTTKLKKK